MEHGQSKVDKVANEVRWCGNACAKIGEGGGDE